MNWSKLFFWTKKKVGKPSISIRSHQLDRKLVKKIQPNHLPRLSQLRYVGSFLSSTEKKLILISTVIFFASGITWGAIWFSKHSERIPAAGGEYSEGLVGQPKYINPLFSSANDIDADLVSLIYSGLFKYNDRQELIPDLASDFSISENGTVYDINLKKDLRWSDNEPLTANDVAYTFETLADPEVESPLLTAFQGVKIEQTGDYSVRFTLKEPFAAFLHSLTVGILPQHIWSELSPAQVRPSHANIQPVGSGPWKLSKFRKPSTGQVQTYTLEQNPNYYRTLPYLHTITFKFYNDFQEIATALKNQDISASSFLPYDLASKIAGKNFNLYQFNLPQYTALFFNETNSTFLKNLESRTALSNAIDKNKIVAEALAGYGEVLQGPILKGTLGYTENLAMPTFDLEKANQILDKNWTKIQPEEFYNLEYAKAIKDKQANIDAIKNNTSTPAEAIAAQVKQIEEDTSAAVRESMSPTQTFYRKNKNNDILSITITTADTPEYTKVANSIAAMWEAAGVHTLIETINSYQLVRDVLRERSYEVLLYGEILGADPDPYPFWHSSQSNYPGLNLAMFSDRSADKLLEDARATTTEKVRAENYQKFQNILAKELPAVFLYTPKYNFIANNDIKGITLNTIFNPADRFNYLPNWYIKTKHQWK